MILTNLDGDNRRCLVGNQKLLGRFPDWGECVLEYGGLVNLVVAQHNFGEGIEITGHGLASIEFLCSVHYQTHNTNLCTK